ncbi:MAG: site-specific DNA-methyltransferase [Pirellulales bacterium]|nr:site-specific DNA-methyltransferase [Pirellulales bacterium]
MGKKKTRGKRPIEQYEHGDKTRVNNPPVGLVTPATDPDSPRKTYQYDPHLDPQLVWAGKAEHTSFEIPTVSLHVHERIDPRTIIRAVQKLPSPSGRGAGGEGLRQRSLFEDPEENPPLREAIEFYKHAQGWTNRLIAGDSLVVMNSLLEKEGLAGKVQMVYIDPPYGIKYSSNFQPFVNKRDVKDKNDQDLTQEPEMIRAFRDTWELGVHSYLAYLRDRLVLTRNLLHESGSCFVQISDDNLHHVRELMDEIFGSKNFVSNINFQSMTPLESGYIENVYDYILWYARDKSCMKYRNLVIKKPLDPDGEFKFIETGLGEYRELSEKERLSIEDHPQKDKIFKRSVLESSGFTTSCTFPFDFFGHSFIPRGGKSWRTNPEGMETLKSKGRLFILGTKLYYKLFYNDFPYMSMTNSWGDTMAGFAETKRYVVQTHPKVIQRCMLMTTDPGDLVFDPTCGSGTTAYVAEQWGRRWITCDTSRVSTTISKQRVMTALFHYYKLAKYADGVGSGFEYKTVPHVTLKSIANNEPPSEELLYDQPEIDKSKARVAGPFTVEAVPAPAVRPVTEIVVESQPVDLEAQPALPGIGSLEAQSKLQFTENVSVARFGETLRQRQWRDELLACGIRAKGGQRIEFARLEPMGGTRWLQCEGETRPHPGPLPKGEGTVHRVVVSFGSEHAPLEQRQVAMALDEAQQLRPTPTMIVFATFQFDPEAAKDIDETKWPGVTLLKVQMNTDLLTDDLKKARSSNESYWLMGQPDVELRQVKKGEHKGKYEVEIHGFDYYNPRTGAIESGDTTKIALWMLDTDYDGRSLFPRQVFFPMAGPKDGWARLAKNLKAEIDEDLIEAYRGTVSLPFEPGEFNRVAVKIVDDRGIESLKIVEVG